MATPCYMLWVYGMDLESLVDQRGYTSDQELIVDCLQQLRLGITNFRGLRIFERGCSESKLL
jgi:hypothetical protein